MTKPSKIYAELLEDTALEQYNSAMELDYTLRGALMPDAHTGYGLPIGGVVETEGVILPSWVGYDIGCGMCAIHTDFDPKMVRANRAAIFEAIYKFVPTGFNVNQHPQDSALDAGDLSEMGQEVFERRKGFRSLGTLGGGNHFIEIGTDEADRVWIVIHSGSRGAGHGIATEYMRIGGGGKVREGHWPLLLDSDIGQGYINDMEWATHFALENRWLIMKRVLVAMGTILGNGHVAAWDELINRNHNHAEKTKDGTWIHRKGATHAELDMDGVIPGNMRDGSFIVKGLGNPESLFSSSHGAGRVMSRKRARNEVSLSAFEDEMCAVYAKVDESTLDESPFAYKNIFDVMDLQKDLVEIVHYITPIINIKA